MTTDCECLREYWCRDGEGECPLKCYPKKIAGCEHWGDNCKACQQAKGVNSCQQDEIQGECQEDGKCKYPDQKCRTNVDCEENEYCTWHNTYVSGSCDPGYYSPNDCPLGECKAYQTKCHSHIECGPGKFCTMAIVLMIALLETAYHAILSRLKKYVCLYFVHKHNYHDQLIKTTILTYINKHF